MQAKRNIVIKGFKQRSPRDLWAISKLQDLEFTTKLKPNSTGTCELRLRGSDTEVGDNGNEELKTKSELVEDAECFTIEYGNSF